MSASDKMIDMFELVGELLSLKGLDAMVEAYNKAPEENRMERYGKRLQICAYCMKEAPETMRRLALLETEKSEEELEAMPEKEITALYQQLIGGVIAPFLA